jgi:hypothetical protein
MCEAKTIRQCRKTLKWKGSVLRTRACRLFFVSFEHVPNAAQQCGVQIHAGRILWLAGLLANKAANPHTEDISELKFRVVGSV